MNWSEIFLYKDGRLFWKISPLARKKVGAEAGTKNGRYRVVRYDNIMYPLHRIVWELHFGPIPPGLIIDHINSDSFDNRIEKFTFSYKFAKSS